DSPIGAGVTRSALHSVRGAQHGSGDQDHPGPALVLPFANADMMNLHLAEISANVAPGAHAVLIVDGAGWHQTGDKVRVPDNITLLRLSPYSPELNPVENIWAYL